MVGKWIFETSKWPRIKYFFTQKIYLKVKEKENINKQNAYAWESKR